MFPPLKVRAAASFFPFRLQRNGRFTAVFACSSSKLIFCIGVSRRSSFSVCFSDTIHMVFRACFFSSSRKRRLFYRYDQKSNGSRVHDFKRKRILTYRTTFRWIGGGVSLSATWVFLGLLGGLHGRLSGAGRAAKTTVRVLLL